MKATSSSISTDSNNRIPLLDALRGLALLGILFVNMTWFTGIAVRSPEERAGLGTETVDTIIEWLIHFTVDGKFWSLFALLFGVSFAIQFRRAESQEHNFTAIFLRRMIVLWLIGLAHAVFIWFGDIVSLYAVVAAALLFFRSSSDRALIRWAVMSGALVPILISSLWLVVDNASRTTVAPTVDPGHGPRELLNVFGTGSYSTILAANWAFLKERWFLAIYSSRFFRILGMFLIGYYAGRREIFHDPARHLKLLRRTLFWGLLIGLPTNVALAFMTTVVPVRPPTALGWLMTSMSAVGVPALCLAYVAGLTLLFRQSSRRQWLIPLTFAGRMSLTNYVLQSVACVIIFYGYGLGFWGRIGVSWSVPLLLSIFAVQAIFSAWWLHHYHHGPLEKLWRFLASGRLRHAKINLVASRA